VYARQKDIGNLYDRTCVSGVLTGSRTLPASMRNRYVAVYGSWLNASTLYEMSLRGQSIGAENYCNADRLFLADRIVALD
jgi:hypothetical protein